MSLEILLWKNWIIAKRNYKTTIFEILFPILFVLMLSVWRRQFYSEDSDRENFYGVAITFLPLLLVFSLFFTVSNTIKVSTQLDILSLERYRYLKNFQNVAIERESQLKELMKIMGLSSLLHWSAWFIKVFISLVISLTAVVALLKHDVINSNPVFAKSGFFVLWLFLVIYAIALITMCFFISTIFKKSSTATNIGTMLFFATVIPYFQFTENFSSFHYSVKFLFCLPVNTGLGEGLAVILRFERDADGLQFANFFSRDEAGFSLAEIMLVMIVAILIHIGLLIYIENVFPGGTGNAKPWHFPFTSCFNRESEKPTLIPDYSIRQIANYDHEESEPSQLKPGIQIKDLCKSFGSFKAVNNLSLNIFEDQITVLLGFNGSGKTTSMNIMTGMIPPSSGTAFVDGFDIRTQTEEARRSLGLCPQKDVLFKDLTVVEHIIFFCRLKGMQNKTEIDAEVVKYTKALGLEDKMNASSKTLSGGMKRKLNTINALCGGSKIVICDEPSSGIDAGARRDLWDLLINEKKGRTILLTTHHMDEAEVLGDRVAILNEGSLQTVGSTYFLKKKYGSGYRLTCVKKDGCDPKAILDMLQRYALDAKLIAEGQTEIAFILLEKDVATFENIFKKLEDDSVDLKISSFGLSITTLEDVFLRIGRETSTRDNRDELTIDVNFDSTQRVTGVTSIFYQIWAMILKHFFFFRRNYQLFIWLTVLSAWFIFIFISAYSPMPDDSTEINFPGISVILTLFFFTLTYWTTTFIAMKIKERTTRSNLLQFICGANRIIFWMTSFLIDWMIFIAAMSIVAGVVAAFQLEHFSTATEIGTLILISVGFSFSILPAIYLISRLFKNHATGEEMIPLIIIICEYDLKSLLKTS